MERVITPVQVKFDDGTLIELTADAIQALRAQAIRELHGWQLSVEEAFRDLGQLDGPNARHELERLGAELDGAHRSADALWWLAPEAGDGEEA